MMNYAETTSIRTIVPVSVPCTLDQMPGTTTLHSLSALLEHPEFQRGLAEADEAFLEAYEPAPLTEEEMVEEIEMNIGRWVTERTKILDRVYGYAPSSYLCNLGFVVGMINKGLTYAQ